MRTFNFGKPQKTVVIAGTTYHLSSANPRYPTTATKRNATDLAKVIKSFGYGKPGEKFDTRVIQFKVTNMSCGELMVWLVYERKVK